MDQPEIGLGVKCCDEIKEKKKKKKRVELKGKKKLKRKK
jgi:hypothetical protein